MSYTGLVSVELPRDSHAGPARATESLAYLTAASTAAAPAVGTSPVGATKGVAASC